MNIKPFIYILICSITISCKTETKQSDLVDYRFYSKTIIESNNTYDRKGRLEKVISKYTTEYAAYPNEKGVSSLEKQYYYDERDSLIKIVSYSLPSRELESIEYLSDSSFQSISYREYPTDTISYTFQKKDPDGNLIEGYYKTNLTDYKDEWRSYLTYEDGLLTIEESENFINKTKILRKYIYRNVDDTLFKQSFEDGNLYHEIKKYKSGDYNIEVVKHMSKTSLDTIYYVNNKVIKSVSYTPDGRDIFKLKYDERGNEIESIQEVWDIKK